MIRIDHAFLVELGLGHLEPEQQRLIERRLYEVIEARVGLVIARSLTSSQLDAFEHLIDQDPEAAQQFIERTVPHYGLVVRNELDLIAQQVARSVRRGHIVTDK